MKETQKIPKSVLGRINYWFKNGDSIPKTHRSGVPITITLLFIGIFAMACAFAPFLGYTNNNVEFNTIPLLVISFLALTPSLYNLWIMVCCWRRVPGYEWSMIPFFD